MQPKKSMDPSNVAMLCTTNEQIYMKERSGETFFQADNDPETAGTGVSKEPEVPFCAVGRYPLEYLLDFFKLAKASKVSHVKFEMARENRPLRLEFESRDNLNQANGSPKLETTWMWLAPRIDNDEVDSTKEKLLQSISFHEKEIEILKSKLPKEEKAL